MITQSATVGDDWARGYDWVTLSGWVWGMSLCFLIVSFMAAVWNIITSTFVDKVLSLQLLWSVVMILFIVYMVALFSVQAMGNYLMDFVPKVSWHEDEHNRGRNSYQDIPKLFGSVLQGDDHSVGHRW